MNFDVPSENDLMRKYCGQTVTRGLTISHTAKNLLIQSGYVLMKIRIIQSTWKAKESNYG